MGSLTTMALLVVMFFFWRPPESRWGLAAFGMAAASVGLFSTMATRGWAVLTEVVGVVGSLANTLG